MTAASALSMARPARRLPLAAAVAAALAEQRSRWALWLPIGLMAGAGWSMSDATRPALLIALAGLALAAAAALAFAFAPSPTPQRPVRTVLAGLSAALASIFAGLAVGEAHAALRGPAVLPPQAYAEGVWIEGWVQARDASNGRLRLVVQLTELGEGAQRVTDLNAARVRISMRSPPSEAPGPGRLARCRVQLLPPAQPIAPGAYDFARRAHFERLSATGFALGRCRPAVAATDQPFAKRAPLQLAAARAELADWIADRNPGDGGAIAAALITGDRTHISPQATEALQAAGLAHVLSVSGMHMAILGGLVFAALRWTLSLIGWLALRVTVPKIAAAAALVVLAAYCVLSGASVPAQRAFLMAAVAFGAILLDRPAISMRGLALALGLIVLWSPEAVLEPGFQMSFAATAALVALYEILSERSRREPKPVSPGLLIGSMQALWAGLAGVLTTSFVAGAATEVFALQHFQRIALYGLPTNLAAAPLITFVAAPAAGAAALLAPFGLAEPPLAVMAWALEIMLGFAAAFAERPEAIQPAPPLPPAAFLAAVAGLLWGCLWRGPARALCCIPIAFALALTIWTGPPVAIVAADNGSVFARIASGQTGSNWVWIGQEPDRFTRERLPALAGVSQEAAADAAILPVCEPPNCPWQPAVQRAKICRGAIVRHSPWAGYSIHAPRCANRPWRHE